jgi:hypothetical protein
MVGRVIMAFPQNDNLRSSEPRKSIIAKGLRHGDDREQYKGR